MPLKPITSDRLAKPVGPFSPAVRDGDRVYTSGQVAQDPATGKLIEGGVAAQTEQIFHNLKVILDAAAKSLADVVKVSSAFGWPWVQDSGTSSASRSAPVSFSRPQE